SASCSIGDVWEHSASATAAIERERVSRLAKAGEIVEGLRKIGTPSGTYWIVPTDYGALVDMLSDDESDLYHTANRIGPQSVVLDCGASVGVFTRAALQRGAKVVVAIEPAAEPLRCLRRNLASEIAQGRVIVYPKGVWDKDAELALTTSDNLATSGRSVALDRGKKGETIQLTTIDRIVQELH